jgi:hypothetical protein
MPEGGLELKDIFRPLMYEPLLTKFAHQLMAGRKDFDAEKIASNLDCIGAVTDLCHINSEITLSYEHLCGLT